VKPAPPRAYSPSAPPESASAPNKRRRLSPNPVEEQTTLASSSSSHPLPATQSQSHPHPAPTHHAPQAQGVLEPSIINAEPLDEFIREIADWILRNAAPLSHVEIEAKIGILIDSRTNKRLNLPVLSETILSPDYPELRFESNIDIKQHAHFNQLLNTLVSNSASSSHRGSQVHYAHTKLIDSFHPPHSNSRDKIRVTTDEKTGKVKESVVKTRVADLNIYSPKRKVDWRISVNVEVPAPPPPQNTSTHTRRKDRITYTHQSFQVDLTQVTPSSSSNAPVPRESLLHELELEFRDSKDLMRLGAMRMRGEQAGDEYDELVRVFVNNVHILVRNVL